MGWPTCWFQMAKIKNLVLKTGLTHGHVITIKHCIRGQNTECADGDVAGCRALTLQMNPRRFTWSISSPTSIWDHSSGLYVRENTPVRETEIQTSHYFQSWHICVRVGNKRNECMWVLRPLFVLRSCLPPPPRPRTNPRMNGMK